VTKNFIPEVDPDKLKKMKMLSFEKLGRLFAAATGHGLFGKHLSKWRDVDPTCSACLEDEESAWHLWSECPAFECIRRIEDDTGVGIELRILHFFGNQDVKETQQRRERELDSLP